MRVFITGASGVIGRRAVPLLVTAGHQVTAVARTPHKGFALQRAGARAVAVDLFDREIVRRAVARHDVIINLATHIPASGARMALPWSWHENDRLRREASAIVAAAAVAGEVPRLIQESFALIYADGGASWLDETAAVEPPRHTRSALDAERSVARFSEAGGVGVALRFAAFYGADSAQSIEMIGMLRRGWAPLIGDPDGYFSMVSHDDAATAVVAALDVPAGVYNVVDDEPLARRELIDVFIAPLGIPRPKPIPRVVSALMGSLGEVLSRSQRISNAKLRGASAWAPRYPSVREGWPTVTP